MENKSDYVVTRYSLLPDTQINLHAFLASETKEQIFLNWLNQFEQQPSQSISVHKSNFTFYCKRISKFRFILKFAKKTNKKINEATKDDIYEKLVCDYPYSNIVIDINTQIMLIQKNPKVFQNIIYFKDTISKCISYFIKPKGISIYIELLTQKHDFWTHIKENKGFIQTVELKLISPNFLKTTRTAREFVQSLKEQYNNKAVSIKLENDDGNLNISEDQIFINDAVKYASSGCGNWKIKTKRNTKQLKSEDKSITMSLPHDIINVTKENIIEIEYVFDRIRLIENSNLDDEGE